MLVGRFYFYFWVKGRSLSRVSATREYLSQPVITGGTRRLLTLRCHKSNSVASTLCTDSALRTTASSHGQEVIIVRERWSLQLDEGAKRADSTVPATRYSVQFVYPIRSGTEPYLPSTNSAPCSSLHARNSKTKRREI